MRNLVLFVLLAPAVLAAAQVQPLLVKQMERLDQGDRIGVLIVLKEQFDAESTIESIKDKQQRWATTVGSLKRTAARSQVGLLVELGCGEESGAVADVTPLWIVNAVYCEAVPEVIERVAERDDVWFVQWDKIPTRNVLAVEPGTKDVTGGAFGIEWNVQKVKADSVWQVYGLTGAGVVVGHVDTGVDYTHPDLADHMWTDPSYPHHGWDFADDDDDPMDTDGHGTHTAGTVAGDGTGGDSTGMAPDAQLMVCRMGVALSPPFPDTIAENGIMRGMQFCVAPDSSPGNHADLITMSLGWIITRWLPREAIWRQCVSNIAAAGIPLFCCAGNEGRYVSPYNIRCPAHCPSPWAHPDDQRGGVSGAMAVGGTKIDDELSPWSSIGPATWGSIAPYFEYPFPPGLLKPDVSAPGSHIASTRRGGGYEQMSGTSMATPCAAGVCALMLERNPGLLPEEVDAIMELTAWQPQEADKNNSYGSGIIDAMACIRMTPSGQRHDVAVRSVLNPALKTEPGTAVNPAVLVTNRGTYPEASVTFLCAIESLGVEVYHETISFGLDSAASDTASFPAWYPGPGGLCYDLTYWHSLASDSVRFNDTLAVETHTRLHDVHAAGANLDGCVGAMTMVIPRLLLCNSDYTERELTAWCRIDSSGSTVYFDSTVVDSIREEMSVVIAFPTEWNVGPVSASYEVTMWHDAPHDERRANDTLECMAEAADRLRVLIVHGAGYTPPESVIGRELRALGDSVEFYDASVGMPTLAELLSYPAIGTYSNRTYADAVRLGNDLADYVDAGGGVVIGNHAFTQGKQLRGRIMSGDYATITPGGYGTDPFELGWYNPSHPVMAGITWMVGYPANATFDTSAESVARWVNGRPYIAVSANRKVVGINEYPGSGAGEWAQVWHNALHFVSGHVTGVSAEPWRGTTASGASVVRGKLLLQEPRGGELLDVTGRKVADLLPGENDVSRLSPGVYFLRREADSGERQAVRKVILQ